MARRLTAREEFDRSFTEAQWQTRVEGWLRAGGWLWYHAPDNRPVTAASGRKYVQAIKGGFPDLIAFRGSRRLALELKRQVGSAPTEEQLRWLHTMRRHGFEVGVFRPSHAGVLEAMLLRGAAAPSTSEVLPAEPPSL